MNIRTNPLVRNNSNLPESKPFNDPIKKELNTNTTNNLKLSFENYSPLNLYVIITGFNGKEHLGKSFLIKKPINKSDLFFQKLYNTIEENGNISLIKNRSLDGTTFWTKGNFEINSTNTIIFTIKNEFIINGKESNLNKLINTLGALDFKSNVGISEKYLHGFLEEKGIATFNEYVNQYM